MYGEFFNLHINNGRLIDEISRAQREADNGYRWGVVAPIKIPA